VQRAEGILEARTSVHVEHSIAKGVALRLGMGPRAGEADLIQRCQDVGSMPDRPAGIHGFPLRLIERKDQGAGGEVGFSVEQGPYHDVLFGRNLEGWSQIHRWGCILGPELINPIDAAVPEELLLRDLG